MENGKQWLMQLFRRISDSDVFGLSAQLAYFLLLSLFPFLLFLMTLIGYLPLDVDQVTDFIKAYAPADIADMIIENMTKLLTEQSGGLLSIGVIGTLWSASNGVKAVMKAFNRSHEVDEDRSFVYGRLIAIVLTILMMLVISVSFLLPIFGKVIGEYVFSWIGFSGAFMYVWSVMRWVLSSVIMLIVLTLLYKLAPNTRVRFKNAIWGAIFATVGWQLVSLAFSYYVNTLGNYSATYGSLGAVIVLMIWLYISGIIINVGGVINAMVMNRKQKA